MKSNNHKINFVAVLTFVIFCTITFNSCSKEEFSVYDQPFEDLKTSYFNYQDSTIVLDASDSRDLVIARDETSITFQNSTVFENLAVGSVIISSVDTPGDDFIMRKVLSISDNGGQIVLQTRLATLYEAYKSYYFDSSLPGIIDTRTDTTQLFDLATLSDVKEEEGSFQPETSFNNLISGIKDGLKEEILPSGLNLITEISMDTEFTGIMNAISIHPHDHFILMNPNDPIFGGETDTQIKINILSIQTDSDNDGISNLVEKSYGTDHNIGTEYPIISQIKIDGFSVSLSPEIAFGKDFSFGTADLLSQGVSKPEIKVALTNEIKTEVAFPPTPLEQIYYVPIPAASVGVFGVAFCWHQIATFNGGISIDVAAKIFSEPIDLVLGVYDLTNVTAEPEMRLERKRSDGILESWTISEYIKTQTDMDLAAIFTAEAELKFGLGLGFAVYAGESKIGQIAVGGMLTPYLYKKITANAAVKYSNIITKGIDFSNTNNYEGFGCFEAGIGIGSYVFIDGNDKFGILEFLDSKVELFDEPVDLLALLIGKKFCIGYPPCEDLTINKFTVEVQPNNPTNIIVSINLSSSNINHKKYTIRFEDANSSLLNVTEFEGEFDYDTDVNRSIINSTNFNNFLSDGSTISMIVESVPETEDQPDCVLSLNNSNAAITHCDPSQTLNFEKTEFGESYFDFTGASNRCQQKGGLITRSQLEEKLLNGICIDASGFRPYPGRSLTNLDKLYVWSDNGNSSGQNLMTVIKPIRDDDGNYTYDIVDESLTALGGSANSMMKCICADQ